MNSALQVRRISLNSTAVGSGGGFTIPSRDSIGGERRGHDPSIRPTVTQRRLRPQSARSAWHRAKLRFSQEVRLASGATAVQAFEYDSQQRRSRKGFWEKPPARHRRVASADFRAETAHKNDL